MNKQVGAAESPFHGIKVTSFAWGLVGPLITKYLADYGATLVHVESIKRPDIGRLSAPYKDGIPGINRSGYSYLHANEYSFALDLSTPKGVEIALRLVARSDIVAESFRAGLMESLGLGYDKLKEVKPDIIMIRTCNQGQTGPHAKHPGFGIQLMGLAGFPYIDGWPDRPPTPPAYAYTDVLAPRFGAAALIAALDYHRRTGKGAYLDLSQLEASMYFLGPAILDYTTNGEIISRMGNSSPCTAPHGVYRCKGDDRWCAIAVFTDIEWQSFCNALGHPHWVEEQRFSTLPERKRNEAELDRLVEEWTAARMAEDVMEIMQANGVAAGVVKTVREIAEDPQLVLRNTFWKMEHPAGGMTSCLGNLSVLTKTPAEPRIPGPSLGQHTEMVCREFLGMSDDEFLKLYSAGVFQ